MTDKGFVEYLGNYDYFIERTKDNPVDTPELKVRNDKPKVNDYKKEKEERAKIRKKQNDIKKIQALIEKLDEEIAQRETYGIYGKAK